ncbi:MAG: TonB-dependent receptor [Cyclobacteriaceae bacterium]
MMKKKIPYLLRKVQKHLLFAGLLQILLMAQLQAHNSSLAKDLTRPHSTETLFKMPMMVPIDGIVVDMNGAPIPGVTVVVEGTTSGTVTDFDGNFNLDVAEGAVLVISFIGYQTQRIPIGNQTSLDIILREELSALNEVVVVGYGTQEKKDLTGAVSSISSKDFADMPVQGVDKALAGRIPGLDIVSSGTTPGSTSQIRLRGNRSFTASNEPLIILNGVPFYGSINDINPYDIESIDVLKDAASTAIYGSRGANGVIIITSKSGQVGPPKFTLESYAGPKMAYGKLPYQNGEQYAERGREALRQAGNYTDPNTNTSLDEMFFDPIEFGNIQAGNSFDYPSALLQNGFQQKHQLTVMGGSEGINYNIAGNVFTEDGLFPGRQFNRYSLNTKLNFKFSDKVTAGVNMLLSHNAMEAKADDGVLNAAVRTSPLGSPYDEDGNPRYLPTGDGFSPHPLADYEWDSFRWDNKRWAAYLNTFADFRILPELNYRINLGTDVKLHNLKSSQGQYSYNRRGGPPVAGNSSTIANQSLYESILTYDKTFLEHHKITATAIHGIQTSREELFNTNVSNIPYETSRYHNIGSAEIINSVGSDLREWNLISYAARLFYGYKSKYLLTLSFRTDGASQFSTDHKWGYFPSAALAWNIMEENFINPSEWLSNVKFRVSYGVTGNQGIDPYQTQGGLSRTTYAWNESPAFGFRSSTLANSDLKWESTETYNIGLDFELYEGRVNVNMEAYHTNTFDLIMLRLLPITTGFNQVLENVGNTRNRGFELGANTVNIDQNNFRWNTDVSFFLNREEIVELFNGKEDDIGNQWFIGQPIHVYYDFKKTGIWQLEEEAEAAEYAREPGQIKVLDLDESGTVNDADRMIIGSRQPDFVANIANNFTYKNWDLAFTTYVRWGNTIYVPHFNPASGKRYNHLALDYWTPNNPTNAHPRPDDDVQGSLQGSSQAYRDGSFIRLRQLSIGYSLPPSLTERISLTNSRIYLSGENLWHWTKSEIGRFNMEPEWAGNAGLMPAIRTFVLGVNVSF